MTFGFQPPFVDPWYASALDMAAEQGFRLQDQPMVKEFAMQTTGSWTNLRATATGVTVLGK